MQIFNKSLSRLSAVGMGALGLLAIGFVGCGEDFLEVAPTGSLNEEVLSSENGVEGLLIGAYSMLGGRGNYFGGASNWATGSIQGGEANKGTDAGDFVDINVLQRYETDPTSRVPDDRWNGLYEGVSRANSTLRVLNLSTDPALTEDDRTRIAGEARFLRALYYFQLKISFNSIPYFDETVPSAEIITTMNTPDVYPRIEEDLMYAVNNLPEVQTAAGRANKTAAKALLGKVYLYQEKWSEARSQFEDVIANGVTANGQDVGLLDDYSDVFNAEFDNSMESIFAVQAAANTGSTNNANPDFVLNFPYNTGSSGPGNCCGFFQPSFDLANSYRTNDDGLPLLDGSYRNPSEELTTDFGVDSGEDFTVDDKMVDPRLDHAVGRRGIPYLDWGIFPGKAWIRDQGFAGPYSPKKYIYYQAQEGSLTDGSSWTRGYTAVNYNIIRFADVLLMAAEANAELGDLERATELVNMVRMRAANEDTFVKLDDGTNAANYKIGLYDTFGSQDMALEAIYFERKLELSGEGYRFYDLVRWGIAADYLNSYLDYESQYLSNALGGASFTEGKNEYLPIPQGQIDLQGADVLKQNPGY